MVTYNIAKASVEFQLILEEFPTLQNSFNCVIDLKIIPIIYRWVILQTYQINSSRNWLNNAEYQQSKKKKKLHPYGLN